MLYSHDCHLSSNEGIFLYIYTYSKSVHLCLMTACSPKNQSTITIVNFCPCHVFFFLQLITSTASVIRPVLEYCAPVWHYTLTHTQTKELEAIQKQAIHIIFQFSRGMSYSYILSAANLTSLSSRRDDLSHIFFLNITNPASVTNPASCLHHFLPRRDPIQLHLGFNHMNITQDPPSAQNNTVHSCNMALPTTSIVFCIDYFIT